MKENEELLEEDIEPLKLSKMINLEEKIDNKEVNLNNLDEAASNTFNYNNIMSSDEEEMDHLEQFDTNYDSNKKKKKINRKILIYNIKDHIMMIFLLLSSSMNFSALYVPLVFIGILYIYFLLNNNNAIKNTKLKIEIGCLIYSIILIIFKLVIIGIIDNGNLDSEKQTTKLNNLGIRYSKDKNLLKIIITFIGEVAVLIASMFSIFISILYKKIEMENINIQITKGKIFSRIKYIIYICYVLLLFLAVYNRSYLTYLYLFIYQILLIIVTLKNNFPVYFSIFKYIRIFLLCFLPIQLFLINIFNIYSYQNKFLKDNIIPEGKDNCDIEKVYSLLTKIGIYYSFYCPLLKFIYGCISYGFKVCIIVLLSSCKTIINDYKNVLHQKNIYELKELNKVHDDDEKNEKNEISVLNKINIFLINFFIYHGFIIHLVRLLSIVYIYYLRSFFSIAIFIGLFCSFIFNEIKSNRYLIIILLIPTSIISFGCLHICNIVGHFENLDEKEKEKYLRLGLEKDEGNKKYILIGLYYLCIILFLNSFTDYSSSIKVKRNLPNKNILMDSRRETENEDGFDNKEPLLIDEMNENEVKINNRNIENKNKNEINVLDVILKFIYQNIDKITLVAMYFISMHTVNIIHFIFIIIFMIQILERKIIERFNKIIIIIIQILFLFEYIVDLTKGYYNDYFKDNSNLFAFLLSLSDNGEININIEIFCYIAIYAFYIQNQLIKSIKYQELEKNSNISLKNYINIKFKNSKIIKYILFIFFNIIIEIYIWTMFCSFFYVCCNFEISLLFSIKLFIFFYVVYNFLQKTQIIEKNNDISLKINSFLIGYCCFNSFIVYGYQLVCLDFIGLYNKIQESDNIIVENLPSIGLKNYHNEDLLFRLLPHFLSNFLSILMFYELKSIYDKIEKEYFLSDKNKDKNKDNTNDIKIVDENINIKNIDTVNNEELNKNNNENEEEINTNNDQKLVVDNIHTNDNIDIKEEKKNYYTKYIEIKNKLYCLNRNYIFFLLILFILKLYHPFIFLLICYIFTTYHLSFSVIFYFLIFGINFISLFNKILNNTCNYNYTYHHPFMFSQLIRYKKRETKKHHVISSKYNYKIFKYTSILTFFCLFLNYIYSIFCRIQNCNDNYINENDNKCNNNTTLIENLSYGDYIKGYSYLFGIFNYYDKIELFKSCGLYILFILLICINIYIQKIKAEIIKNKTKNRDDYYDNNIRKMYLKNIIFVIKNIGNKTEDNNNDYRKIYEELIKNYKKIGKTQYKEFIIDKNNFEDYFINIFKKSKNNNIILSHNSTIRSIIIFFRISKKIFEYFIIFVLICGVIIKINIWSIIYMTIVIYLLLTKKNINKFKSLFIIIIISIFIQSVVFLSNITTVIDPRMKKDIIPIINEKISFNSKYLDLLGDDYDKHSIILGLGKNRTQLLLIWFEYILIVLIYIYLNYFCYNIFNNKYVESNEWKKEKNSLIYKLLFDKKIRDSLLKMKNSHQYKAIFKCMKSNFDIKLASFSNVLNSINKQNQNNKSIILQKKRHFKINLFDYIFYLFGQNIILIVIGIISMMISGFLSAIYICFCLYFLFKSKTINKGKINFYPFAIKSFLRPIIILDITCQLMIQIPYIYFDSLSKEGLFKSLSDGLGLIRITDDENELTNKVILLLGKCFCFFCMCLQKVIYSSKSFNEYYLSYLIIKNESFKFASFINSFKYNNERIKTMNKSIQLKKDMEDLMKNLQKDLIEWNNKLLTQEDNDINNNIKKNNNIDYNNKNINYDINSQENNNKENNNKENNEENNNEENNNEEKNSEENNEENNIEKNEEKKNEENKNKLSNNILNRENNKSNNNLNNLINDNHFLNEDKIIEEKTIKKIVKDWILNQSILLKIHLFLNSKAFCYRMAINEKEEDKFIINTIQGRDEYIPLIERKIDEKISKLNLSVFKNNEINYLKKFLKQLNKINSYDFTKMLSFLNIESEKEKDNKKKSNEFLKQSIKQEKYNQFSKIKNSKLFKKYLRSYFLLKKMIIDIEIILSNNFNLICYFVMIFNHILNASIISLFYPISIFCYALLENPRPPRKYWKTCLIYTFFFLIIKCFFQKEFIGAFLDIKNEDSETYYKSLQIFFDNYPIGIKLFDENNTIDYFKYLLADFMVIIILIINIHFLIINGLWENNEKYIENIYEALLRITMNKDITFENENQIKKFNKEYILDRIKANRYFKRSQTILKNHKNEVKNMINLKSKYIEETKNYYQKLFPKIRNEKPGRDFYYIYSFTMIIIIFYILLYYTTMVQDKAYGAVNISTNQFSGMTIILVLIHMIILIFDRVIYLRQNRYLITYEYNFFDKQKHKLIPEDSFDYEEIKNNIIKLYPDCNKNNNFKIPLEYIPELNKKYNIIFFQNESFNIPLLEKYILHILLTILSHIFIFFFITMAGNYNLNNSVYCNKESKDECNNFLENKSIVLFYLIFVIYHVFSALQIKYGFYDLKRKSIFKNINSIQGLLFEIYKLIPFFYQIKNVVDWTFTPTSLDLFNWFKFESIYDEIFKTYRIKYPIEKKPIGKKIKTIFKIIIGGFISFILVLILVLPLILFSSLNPTNEINNITSAQMKIYLSFIDNNQQEKNYLIFENYWAEGINNMTKEVWKNFGYYNSFYSKNFPQEQIQIISFYAQPENPLSEFKLYHIISSIESLLKKNDYSNKTNIKEIVRTCNLIIQTDFSRPLPSEAKTVTKRIKLLICDYLDVNKSTGCIGLNDVYNFFTNLNDNSEETNIYINISGFSPFIRLTANSEPKQIDLQINKALLLKPSINNNTPIFEVYFDNITEEKGIQYHAFNDKVSSSTFGYSIIGFYSAFILVIGTYVTNIFNYNPEKVVIGEMPHPEKLLNLCECVKISRYTYDFKKEEYLYNILIEIMRTPDFLKKLTQSNIEQFQRRKSILS